jgi:hypothetical protein
MNRKVYENLNSLTKSALNSLAKDLGLKNIQNIGKEELIKLLMNPEYSKTLKQKFRITFWSVYHTHVYGIASLVALLWGFVTFCNPNQENTQIRNIMYLEYNESINKANTELIELLNNRAKNINILLEKYEGETLVDNFLKEFNQLHSEHIEAIQNNQSVLSHNLLNEIHGLISRFKTNWNDKNNMDSYLFDSYGDTVYSIEPAIDYIMK